MELIQRMREATEALERLRATRDEALREYAGEGHLIDSEGDRLSLRAWYERLGRAIRALEYRSEVTQTRVTLDGVGSLMPDAIVGAYEFLYVQAYGSESSRGEGRGGGSEIGGAEQWLTKSDGTQTRGPAKHGKKYAASVTSVMKNERAFELKKKVDKRLRALARDIRREWEGLEEEERVSCFSCHKIAEKGWKWCPRCGDRLVRNK